MSERTTVLVRLHQIRTRVQQNKIKNQYGPISSGPELAAVGSAKSIRNRRTDARRCAGPFPCTTNEVDPITVGVALYASFIPGIRLVLAAVRVLQSKQSCTGCRRDSHPIRKLGTRLSCLETNGEIETHTR